MAVCQRHQVAKSPSKCRRLLEPKYYAALKTVKGHDFRVFLFYQAPIALKQVRRESKPAFGCHISTQPFCQNLKIRHCQITAKLPGMFFSRHSAVLMKICIATVYTCSL